MGTKLVREKDHSLKTLSPAINPEALLDHSRHALHPNGRLKDV
jgi:hypothetical protein